MLSINTHFGILGKRIGTALLLVSALWSQSAFGQVKKTVKLVSDPYPPYVMDEPARKGFVTDIALKAFKDAGYDAEYINVPYKRALAGLDEAIYDGLLAVSPGRKNYIYPEASLGNVQTIFFVRKESTWEYKGMDSLRSISLGVVGGYEYGASQVGGNKIDPYIEANKTNDKFIQPTHGDDALVKNIKKLSGGRIGATMEDESVFWYTAKQAGLAGEFKAAGDLTPQQKLSVGFNLNNPRAKELAKVLSDGVQKLKANGEYAKILESYGLK